MRLTAESIFSYILPGTITDPRVGLDQAADAERLGLGGILLSERWETKELGAVMGALTRATHRITLVAGLTHFGTRHPLVQAGMSATLQLLSGNRFIVGYGRAAPSLFRKQGIPIINNQGMADYVGILRKLWAGETVRYSGSAGDYPEMRLAAPCNNPPPILIGAVGPKTLALAGAHFDGIVLHPFLTVDAVARSKAIVHQAALAAGRDPSQIRIFATVVTCPDTLPAEQRTDIVEARAVSYFMHPEIGTPVAAMNGWSDKPIHDLVEAGIHHVETSGQSIQASREAMARAAELLPAAWLSEGTAIGNIDQCVQRLADYADAGADSIVLHGTLPAQQASILAAIKESAS